MLAFDVPTTDEVIRTYLDGCPRDAALSMSVCLRALRPLLRDCDLTDRELADLIATHAVMRGCSAVIFDVGAKKREIERTVD